MEAGDLEVEVQLAFLKGRAAYDPAHPRGATLDTYLWAYARQAALHAIRSRCNLLGMPQNAPGRLVCRVFKASELEEDGLAARREASHLDAGFADADLSTALADLPEPDKTIANMLSEGYRLVEISAHFGRSPAWIQDHLRKIRLHLIAAGWP